MQFAKSKALLERAERVIPAGVNSPVRAYRAVGGSPPFIARASGSRLVDCDANEYVDYIGSWGPAIVGHAATAVVQAVQRAAQAGLSFGAPTELEIRFAEAIVERFPSIQKLRCVSSGTEATMSALRVARGFTRRDVVVKFDGGYHGHADALLVKAGSGAATFGSPDSGGVPAAMVASTVSLPYNDVSALERLFGASGQHIAAVIVEPVAGNMGCVPPVPGFLEGILALCQAHGAVSIFDEVMTGCRLAPGGAQERFGLRPDMTCLGKVVGGGMPLAVYGGRAEIMDCVAPLGAVYQAGTLSGNPLAVSAGLATLNELTPAVYELLEARGARLERGLARALSETKVAGWVTRVGSMLTLFFHHGPVRCYEDVMLADRARFATWHRGLLARGIYWPPSQFEAAFISAAHTEEEIDWTIEVARAALAEC
ncbi:MAG: glutamate-1-semialdehyde 2,1-aminomutase [Verrucomicrobia bacterium]|nr:glutamate-1-semialdehyde 2,1-aminomutase [Verrucomicrobiota bacterium]